MDSIGRTSLSTPPPSASGRGGTESSLIIADQHAAAAASLVAERATRQLLAHEKERAITNTLKADKQAIDLADSAVQSANAKIQADENRGGSLDISA